MPRFDRIMALDWSAAGQPKRGADSIWVGCDRDPPVNPPTRALAERLLRDAVTQALRDDARLLIGVDFAFGHPAGLAQRITGQDHALALWDHLDAQHHDDDRNVSNYRQVAARLNRALGRPVFWGDGRATPTPGLPRLKPPPHPDLPNHRATEARFPGGPHPKSAFQLAGAGAVGAQSLTGIPVLNRLRQQPGVAVWPFQPVDDATVVLVEIYPAIIAAPLRGARGYPCADAAQVDVLARALRLLDDAEALAPLMAPDPRIPHPRAEGQILGFGHEASLCAAARRVIGPDP